MARPYQPLIHDKDRSIRKAIERIRRKTRHDKSAICEMIMKCGLVHIQDEIPELKESK